MLASNADRQGKTSLLRHHRVKSAPCSALWVVSGSETGGDDLLTMTNSNVVSIRNNRETEIFPRMLSGGARRDRTDDLKLAKLPLSQLSYGPGLTTSPDPWWAWEDLNLRPHAYQARALTN